MLRIRHGAQQPSSEGNCNECSYETNGHMYKDQKGETLIIVMICAYCVIRGDQHVAAHN
jgi:hypothetical protein